MFVYKISELLESLKSAQKDGFEYVSLSIIEADSSDDEPDYDTVCLEYICDKSSSEDDMIDSSPLPEDYYCSSVLD